MTETVNLTPATKTMRRRWKTIAFSMVIFLLAGLAYSFFWPPIWQVDAVIIPNLKDAEASSIGSLLSPNAATPLSIMKGALDSKSAIDALMKKTGLPRLQAQNYLAVIPDEHTNELSISAKDSDQKRAMRGVWAAITSLQDIYSRTIQTTAQIQAEALKKTIADKQVLLKAAEDKVATFASRLNIVADPTASASEFYLDEFQKQQYTLYTLDKQLDDLKARAQHVATNAGSLPTGLPTLDQWRARVVELFYEYETTVKNSGPQNPDALRLKNQLDSASRTMQSEQQKYLGAIKGDVDKDIAQLEMQRDAAQAAVEYLRKRVREAPGVSLEFKRLAEEALVQEKVVSSLREKYEEAKVEAEVSQVKFAVLDAPYVEDLPINHRPVRYGGLGALVGFIVASIYVVQSGKKEQAAA